MSETDKHARQSRAQALEANIYGLTEKELEAMRCVAEGLTGEQGAKRLGISPSSYRSRIERVYLALRVGSPVVACLKLDRLGLLKGVRL